MKSNPDLFKERYKNSTFFHKSLFKHKAKVRVWVFSVCVCVCVCVCFNVQRGESKGRLVLQVKPTNQAGHFNSRIDNLKEKVQKPKFKIYLPIYCEKY